MGLIVQKFGGTSVANATRIRNVARIITDTYRAGNDVVAVSYTHLYALFRRGRYPVYAQ